MKLIHFKGLNCYSNCVVSAAASLGVSYAESFATLWSETDFSYHALFRVYSTKRMGANLEKLGARLTMLPLPTEAERERGMCPPWGGAFAIIGMDAFHIPWSPVYQALHDPHFFFAREEGEEGFRCFDPTYNKAHMPIRRAQVVSRAYEVWRMEKVPPSPLRGGIAREARNVARKHPRTKEKLLARIDGCAAGNGKKAETLARYTAALICNRRLFARYLGYSPAVPQACRDLFDTDFFSRWEAVKNGLYKAALRRDDQSVAAKARKALAGLMDQETAMAERIVAETCPR